MTTLEDAIKTEEEPDATENVERKISPDTTEEWAEKLFADINALLDHELPMRQMKKDVEGITGGLSEDEVKELRRTIDYSLSVLNSRLELAAQNLLQQLKDTQEKLEEYSGKYKGKAVLKAEERLLLGKLETKVRGALPQLVNIESSPKEEQEDVSVDSSATEVIEPTLETTKKLTTDIFRLLHYRRPIEEQKSYLELEGKTEEEKSLLAPLSPEGVKELEIEISLGLEKLNEELSLGADGLLSQLSSLWQAAEFYRKDGGKAPNEYRENEKRVLLAIVPLLDQKRFAMEFGDKKAA